MKELNEQDRERIEHYWKKYCEPGNDNIPNVMLKAEFIKVFESVTIYQREQQAKFQAMTPDDLDLMNLIKKLKAEIALINGTILDKDIQIKQLEAERSELLERVSSLTKERKEMVEVELCTCEHHHLITGTRPLCFACTGKKKYLLSKFEP